MSTGKRYDRPGLYWTVTREKQAPFTYVTMRVTSLSISKVNGGIGDVGTFRAHEECFGRFETMNDAGRYASQLNFELAQLRMMTGTIDQEIARLEAARQELIDACEQRMFGIKQSFPNAPLIMADRYARA